MSEEEINIAIAEACGLIPSELIMSGDLPNYCNDLNAMHDAEEAIAGILWRDYFERLQRHGKASGVRATARERAEAFLRTIGKWEEQSLTKPQTISNINTIMTKVYIVFKRSDYSEAILLSVHATKEGAKKECQRLYERRISTRNPYNPYYWDEQEVQP